MNTGVAPIEALLRTITAEIDAGQTHDFAVVTFEPLSSVAPADRDKLLDWAGSLLATCLQQPAVAARWDGGRMCLAVLPDTEPEVAGALADSFGRQLNKLPVGGVAPGEAWRWHSAPYSEQPAYVHDLAQRLKASSRRQT